VIREVEGTRSIAVRRDAEWMAEQEGSDFPGEEDTACLLEAAETA